MSRTPSFLPSSSLIVLDDTGVAQTAIRAGSDQGVLPSLPVQAIRRRRHQSVS